MRFECLVVKQYRGTTKFAQKKIVEELGFRQIGNLLWELYVPNDQISNIESKLMNKVPYRKEIVK